MQKIIKTLKFQKTILQGTKELFDPVKNMPLKFGQIKNIIMWGV